MIDSKAAESLPDITFCSSLDDEVWQGLDDPASFESWHFDAISDDGREAVVVTFYDNYILSTRTQRHGHNDSADFRFPAISFSYAVNGRTVLHSTNEFDQAAFSADKDRAECRIAASSFRPGHIEYGSGYLVSLDLGYTRGRRLSAELEWLSIEADLAQPTGDRASAHWNLAIPRADVTGKITVEDHIGRTISTFSFRGTGYHDHIISRGLHYKDLSSRMWGRAHFFDTTVVFDRHGGVQDHAAPGRFFLIRNGRIEARDSSCQATEHQRVRWGPPIPRRIWFRSDDGLMIRIKPQSAIHSDFHQTQLLSEVTLGLRDGRARKTIGLTEFINPRRLPTGVYRWIAAFADRR
jgi:hypothetical protein